MAEVDDILKDGIKVTYARKANDKFGFPVYVKQGLPRNTILIYNGDILCDLSSWWVIKFGRTPLWTRHMHGTIEGERDKRGRARSRR